MNNVPTEKFTFFGLGWHITPGIFTGRFCLKCLCGCVRLTEQIPWVGNLIFYFWWKYDCTTPRMCEICKMWSSFATDWFQIGWTHFVQADIPVSSHVPSPPRNDSYEVRLRRAAILCINPYDTKGLVLFILVTSPSDW